MTHRLFDTNKMFEDAKSMASGFTVGTATSTNKVDMGIADGDEGDGPEIVIRIENPTSASSNTGTIQVVVQDSADNASFATIMTGKVSTANAGDMNPYRLKLPPKHRRYLQLQFVVGTANFTAGTLHAGVV